MPLEELRVPATDRGLLLGDAVYETLRTYDGRLFALGDHLDRLTASMHAIGLQAMPARDDITRWLRAATRSTVDSVAPEAVVRVTVTRGSGPHGISPAGAGPPRCFIMARALPVAAETVWSEGLKVVTASLRRVPHDVQDPTVKATSALALIMARLEADKVGADEALLRDANGAYLEATSANLFALRDGVFWTPRGEHGVLEGVTGRFVARLLEEEGWRARHAPIPLDVLRGADEVLLTQTTREVIPVVQVDAAAVGTGRPGAMAARLRQRFRTIVPQHLD